MADPFIGEVKMFGFSFPPRGWASCAGGTINIAQNPSLFAVISNTYGGDGRITMGLPNLKGKAPMQWGDGPGLSRYTYGENGGSQTADVGITQIPSHSHNNVVAFSDNDQNTPAADMYIGKYAYNAFYDRTPDNPIAMADEALGNAGNSLAHENRQPFLTVNFCIAMEGIFPPRN